MSTPACLVACSKALLPDSLALGSSAEAKGIAPLWEKPHTMTTAESHWGILGTGWAYQDTRNGKLGASRTSPEEADWCLG